MKQETRKFLATLSFIALAIIALLLLVENVLPLIGVTLGGTLFRLLNTIKNVFIMIVVGVSAYSFVNGKAKWLLWVFWIAIIIIAVATVLMWI